MKKLNLLFLAIIAITLNSCKDKYPDLEDGIYAEIITTKGTAVAKLYYEQAPMTVANFISLAEGTSTAVDSTYKGKKFYNGIKFHRIIKDFMIQGGDPTGTGGGSPGYKFPDEFSNDLKHTKKGILSMANSGYATNGSQFFITLVPTPHLDGYDPQGNLKPCDVRGVSCHAVFGEIVLGQDVVDSIGGVETTKPGDKPVNDVVMQEVNIIRKGSNAKSFDASKIFTDKLQALEEEKAEKERVEKERSEKIAAKYAELKKKATKLESGLEILFLNKGDGESPKIGDNITVNYEGYFADGKMFDTSFEDKAKEFGVYNPRRGAYGPMPMPYSPDAQMIPGFKEGALQMKNVGDKAVLFIPSHLAYGERGGGPIPPNTDLIFELEVMGIQAK
ncbi:peptidylprolyl isomerase [Aquimarina sp. 2201CG5-10]|uniref:peptidylprolyl isomerase n=1 Tax=Aquimarina callyspongiae TaxID=3098150 RepID=UPI002AB5088D|nr:peptidylprolyl isomerase [Aquimarina sp. 2201CG5-10]MDY8137675.1 peptidylprolyl isomerase [Aquimarina sp. 2201CG5-10]